MELSQYIQIFGNREEDLLAIINDDAGNADLTLFLDGVKLGTVVTVFEELLEREHAAGNVHGSILDAGLIEGSLQRTAVFAVFTEINNNFLHGGSLLLSYFGLYKNYTMEKNTLQSKNAVHRKIKWTA
jgi:hypothetical protein